MRAHTAMRTYMPTITFRTKLDPSNDLAFYDFPRFCYHVDDNFIAQVCAPHWSCKANLSVFCQSQSQIGFL